MYVLTCTKPVYVTTSYERDVSEKASCIPSMYSKYEIVIIVARTQMTETPTYTKKNRRRPTISTDMIHSIMGMIHTRIISRLCHDSPCSAAIIKCVIHTAVLP